MNTDVDMLGVLTSGASVLSGSMGSMGGMQSSDDGSRKTRKPYTITKARENWSEQEHKKFLQALHQFDRDWKKIEKFVGSKTVIQIRSHAQKYFLKVQKMGTGEHVPPPRPKRKSAQPYPQKASKTVSVPHTGVMGRTVNPQPTQSEPCFQRFQSSSIGSNSGSWQHHSMPPVGQVTPDHRGGDQPTASVKPAPDFAEVYSFIGSVFQPGSSGHLKKLKEMAPIDRETVIALMKNLSLNISSSNFEDGKMPLPLGEIAGPESRSAGAEHQMALPIPPCSQARLDADEDSAVSGQPGPNYLSESADSGSPLDTIQRSRVMPSSYSDGAMEAPQPRRQGYDWGGSVTGRSMGPVLPINPYPALTSSWPLMDMSSMGGHRMMSAHSHPHMAVLNGSRADMGFAMPLQALAGVDGGLDNWMC